MWTGAYSIEELVEMYEELMLETLLPVRGSMSW